MLPATTQAEIDALPAFTEGVRCAQCGYAILDAWKAAAGARPALPARVCGICGGSGCDYCGGLGRIPASEARSSYIICRCTTKDCGHVQLMQQDTGMRKTEQDKLKTFSAENSKIFINGRECQGMDGAYVEWSKTDPKGAQQRTLEHALIDAIGPVLDAADVSLLGEHYSISAIITAKTKEIHLQVGGVVRKTNDHDVKGCVDAHPDCKGIQCDECEHFPHPGKDNPQ